MNTYYVEVCETAIDVQSAIKHVITPQTGSVVTFMGIVRDHNQGQAVRYLEYETYHEMAQKKLEEVVKEAQETWEIQDVALVHRVGHLEIGDIAVVIAVASAHRNAGFQACHYIIDRLKKVVPIWKKEFFEGGEAWL